MLSELEQNRVRFLGPVCVVASIPLYSSPILARVEHQSRSVDGCVIWSLVVFIELLPSKIGVEFRVRFLFQRASLSCTSL